MQRDAFSTDFFAAQVLAYNRTVSKTLKAQNSTWDLWVQFCQDHGVEPNLEGVDDKTLFLFVFALRYRQGAGNSRHKPVTAGTVAASLRAVGKRFTDLALPDPRMLPDSKAKYTPSLEALLRSFAKDDDAPSRRWPVTLTIIEQLFLPDFPDLPYAPALLSLAKHLIVMAFYFLCRTGEYASGGKDVDESTAFRFCDVIFGHADRQHKRAHLASLNDVNRATAAQLEFTDQKNAVKGEKIGHLANYDNHLCPVAALRHIVTPLIEHNAPPTHPLHTVYDVHGKGPTVTPHLITALLRTAAAIVEHITGIPPVKISSYSLRAGGATALLVSGRDPYIIQLVDRWKSDAMIRYLHVQAMNLTSTHSRDMLLSGKYTFRARAPADNTPDLLPDGISARVTRAITGTLTVPPPSTKASRLLDPYAPEYQGPVPPGGDLPPIL